jgi:hypothetical protein
LTRNKAATKGQQEAQHCGYIGRLKHKKPNSKGEEIGIGLRTYSTENSEEPV